MSMKNDAITPVIQKSLPPAAADRALAAYLGFACGDALGATVEFMSPRRIRDTYGVHTEIIGGGWLGLKPGQITDDTQMSLVLGNAIIEDPSWNLKRVADAFLAWLNSFPPDVGDTCRRGLVRYRTTGTLQGPPADNEAGNGACMRNLPVVLATLHRPAYFERWTLEQSHITHHNPLSDVATLTLGRITRALILGLEDQEITAEVDSLLSQFEQFRFSPYPGRATGFIVHTLQTILHYYFTSADFESCVVKTVNQGGDADTTGALAGMLAGARYGLSQIPSRWLQQLEPGIVAKIQSQVCQLLALND